MGSQRCNQDLNAFCKDVGHQIATHCHMLHTNHMALPRCLANMKTNQVFPTHAFLDTRTRTSAIRHVVDPERMISCHLVFIFLIISDDYILIGEINFYFVCMYLFHVSSCKRFIMWEDNRIIFCICFMRSFNHPVYIFRNSWAKSSYVIP